MKRYGALPSQTVLEMIAAEFIKGAAEDNVQPASLDLTLSDEMYRVQSVFVPRPGEEIRHAMKFVEAESRQVDEPLEVGVTYLARLNESLVLPFGVYGYANPKSSTGRNDVHVRMLADGMTRFDSAGAKGYRGTLWALITPRSYRVKLAAGQSLLQIRFFNQDTRFSNDSELEIAYQRHRLLFTPDGDFISYSQIKMRDYDGTLILTINLDLDIVGYRCEASQKVLDFARRDFYDPVDFFQPIMRPKKGSLVLRRGDFYIFVTKEYLRVPPELAAEMAPVDVRAGDYRAQYAGYFDPGWGFGPDGVLKGAPAVLEVRSFEDNITIRDGQPICKFQLERMTELPDIIYGERGSHYLHQRGPRLSKHFKQK